MNEKQIALFSAAEKGELKKVQALLAEGVSVNTTNTYNETILIVAIRNGHSELAKDLLQQSDIDLYIQGYLTGTALTFAVFSDKIDIATLLLQQEQQFDNLQHPGALNWAVWKNNKELLRLFKFKGADFDSPGLSGLDQEDQEDQDESLEKSVTSSRDTPFHLEYFPMLTYTPLCLALCQGEDELAQFLLQKCNADPNVPNSDGVLPLSIAKNNADEATIAIVEGEVKQKKALQSTAVQGITFFSKAKIEIPPMLLEPCKDAFETARIELNDPKHHIAK